MLPAPRIIAIDDNQRHLDGLADGLNRSGAACLKIQFSGDPSVLKAYPHVRVIFADLHLTEEKPGTDQAKHLAVIGGFLEENICPSGPYLIVLWTRYPEQAGELEKFLHERLEGVPKPIAVIALDKASYIDLTTGALKDPATLTKAIQELLQTHPEIAALINWEECVLSAAADSVSAILEFSASKKTAKERQTYLRQLLCRLAIEAVGESYVDTGKFRAVNEALLPILADRISTLKPDAAADAIWKVAFEMKDADAEFSLDEAAALNKLLHLAESGDGTDGSGRGAVIALPARLDKENFEKNFGLSQELAAKEEFWCSNYAKESDQFKWLLIQVQAPCDFAQRQRGPLPFVLALQMPWASTRKESMPGATWKSRPFSIENKAFALVANARFQISLIGTEAKAAAVQYRLRESFLSDLVFKLQGNATRPGMISFFEKKKK